MFFSFSSLLIPEKECMRGKFLRLCLYESVFFLISYLIDSLAGYRILIGNYFLLVFWRYCPNLFYAFCVLLRVLMSFWYFTICIGPVCYSSLWKFECSEISWCCTMVQGYFHIEPYTQRPFEVQKLKSFSYEEIVLNYFFEYFLSLSFLLVSSSQNSYI